MILLLSKTDNSVLHHRLIILGFFFPTEQKELLYSNYAHIHIVLFTWRLK